MQQMAGRLESVRSQDWLDAGFTGDEFTTIFRLATGSYNQGKLTIETALRWKNAGFSVRQMFDFRAGGIHCEDAIIWRELLGETELLTLAAVSIVRIAYESSDSEIRKLKNPRIGGLWGKLPGQTWEKDYTKLIAKVEKCLGKEKRNYILALAYKLQIAPAGMFEAIKKARGKSLEELLTLITEADDGKLAGAVVLCDDELKETGAVPVSTLRVALRGL